MESQFDRLKDFIQRYYRVLPLSRVRVADLESESESESEGESEGEGEGVEGDSAGDYLDLGETRDPRDPRNRGASAHGGRLQPAYSTFTRKTTTPNKETRSVERGAEPETITGDGSEEQPPGAGDWQPDQWDEDEAEAEAEGEGEAEAKEEWGEVEDEEAWGEAEADWEWDAEAASARGDVAALALADVAKDKDVVRAISDRLISTVTGVVHTSHISCDDELLAAIVEHALSVPLPPEAAGEMESSYRTFYAHGLWRAVHSTTNEAVDAAAAGGSE